MASEVVQRRLGELFAQLQTPAVAPPPVAEPEVFEEEEWLARLRPVSVAEPEAGSGDAGSVDTEPVDAEPRESVMAGLPARVIGFTKDHLTTVIVVLLVGVAWTAYSLLQVRSTPVADAAPRVQSSPSPSGATPAPAPAGTAGPQVLVHVIGAVNHPGVVTLPNGARVADAIAAAGGLTAKAAVGELNLAQVIADGTQLKIGSTRHPGAWIRDASGASGGAAEPPSGGGNKVSLNKATLQQLDALPGIGPVTAQKILDWRKAHGRFTAVTELQEVDGIGPKTYADLADRVQL